MEPNQRPMTRDELLAYVATLGHRSAKLYYSADSIVMECEDTLSEDFQLAAAVLAVFEERARQWKGEEKLGDG